MSLFTCPNNHFTSQQTSQTLTGMMQHPTNPNALLNTNLHTSQMSTITAGATVVGAGGNSCAKCQKLKYVQLEMRKINAKADFETIEVPQIIEML